MGGYGYTSEVHANIFVIDKQGFRFSDEKEFNKVCKFIEDITERDMAPDNVDDQRHRPITRAAQHLKTNFMMIEIEPVHSRREGMFVNEADIAKCWRQKIVDKEKRATYQAIFPSFDLQVSLIKKDEIWGQSSWEDPEGNLYLLLNVTPSEFMAAHPVFDPYAPQPGWNKVTIIPEEWHWAYYVELVDHNPKSVTSKVYYGREETATEGTEIIEVTEKTYKTITKSE